MYLKVDNWSVINFTISFTGGPNCDKKGVGESCSKDSECCSKRCHDEKKQCYRLADAHGDSRKASIDVDIEW